MLANPNYCDDNTMMVIQMLAEGLYQRLLLSIDEIFLFDLFNILLRNINILPKFNLINNSYPIQWMPLYWHTFRMYLMYFQPLHVSLNC